MNNLSKKELQHPVSSFNTTAKAADSLPLKIDYTLMPGVEVSDGIDALQKLFLQDSRSIDEAILKHGAILFRGFGISSLPIFEEVVRKVSSNSLDYISGNSPRKKMTQGVYSSTEYPAKYEISLHNELSYSALWPDRILFCCVVAPIEGGQTPLVRSRLWLESLPQDLVEEFLRKDVTYVRNLHGGNGFGRSWQDAFETSNRSDVANYARKTGASITWNPDNSVTMMTTRPATVSHPITHEEVWFNQADLCHPSTLPPDVYESLMELYDGDGRKLPENVYFGDGTEISIEALRCIRQTGMKHATHFDWIEGDLLLVDNVLVAHGRMPYKGDRKILVSMSNRNV